MSSARSTCGRFTEEANFPGGYAAGTIPKPGKGHEMKTLLKRRRKPRPNAFIGGQPIHLDLAHSIEDIVVICGCCDRQMTVRGEDIICEGCGYRENADDLFEGIAIFGPLAGGRVTYFPDDM